MNKITVIVYTIYVMMCQTSLYGQNLNFSDQYGKQVIANNNINDLINVVNYEYSYYKKPLKLPLEGNVSDLEKLDSPDKTVSVMLMANSPEKLKLVFEGGKSYYDLPSFLSYKAKQKALKSEIIARLRFEYKDTNYCMVLISSNAINPKSNLSSFLLIEVKNQWKITNRLPWASFLGYLYLKPEVFSDIIMGKVNSDLFKQKYPKVASVFWHEGIFFENRNFVLNMFQTYENPKFNEDLSKILLPNTGSYKVSKDICILSGKYKSQDNVFCLRGEPIQYSITSSVYSVNLYKYDAKKALDDLAFSKWSLSSKTKYDSIPELALVSWLFSNSMAEKRSNSIGFYNIEKQAEKYIKEEGLNNRVEWFYHKILFNCRDGKYVYIKFSEWYCKPDVTNKIDGGKEKWVGDKSMLLKLEDNKWKPVFDLNHYLMPWVREFDKLNYDGIYLMLSGEWQKMDTSDETYKFFKYEGVPSPPDNRIYTNQIRLVNDATIKIYNPVPKKISRGFAILGPVDRYRVDDALPYWMDRK